MLPCPREFRDTLYVVALDAPLIKRKGCREQCLLRIVNACRAKHGSGARVGAVSQFSSVEFRYRENYNLIVIARLEFRSYHRLFACNHRDICAWLFERWRSVDRAEEDKFPIKYSMEHT